jgi:hypothetical protein
MFGHYKFKKHFFISLSFIIPVIIIAQEWTFDTDSLKDVGPDIPMILNPFIEGYTPIIDYREENLEDVNGKVYNGFQVQVIEVNNLIDAEIVRDTLLTMIDGLVEVIFDAPNYKVRAGAFVDRLDAEELQQKLYRLGYRRSWIVRARLTY